MVSACVSACTRRVCVCVRARALARVYAHLCVHICVRRYVCESEALPEVEFFYFLHVCVCAGLYARARD